MAGYDEVFPGLSGEEFAFDDPREDSESATDIPGSEYRYYDLIGRVLEYHTGSRDVFLSAAEEQELARTIEANLTDEGELLEPGKTAADRLIETYLRLARYYALASMNMLSPPERSGTVEQIDQDGGEDLAREEVFYSGHPPPMQVGAYADIRKLRSRHAELEERIQVANLALVQAARSFIPKLDKRGNPITFFTHAIWRIHGALSRHAKMNELSGWYVPAYIVDKIYGAGKVPDSFTPAKLATLRQYEQGRHTTPFEELDSLAAAPEETDYFTGEPTKLSLAEITGDERANIGATAYDQLVIRLRMVLDLLIERETDVDGPRE